MGKGPVYTEGKKRRKKECKKRSFRWVLCCVVLCATIFHIFDVFSFDNMCVYGRGVFILEIVHFVFVFIYRA